MRGRFSPRPPPPGSLRSPPSPARGEGIGAARHEQQAHLHRPRRAARGRAAHALHLAAEGARGRHRAQPRDAGRRDGAADPDRDPHRRHAGVEAPAPAPRSAAHPAHHAGAARADPGVARRAVPVRLAAPRRARRTALAGDVASAAICSRSGWRGCSRWRRISPSVGLSATVAEPDDLRRYLVPQPQSAPRARRSRDRRRRRAAACHHARHRRAPALGRAFRAPRHRRNLRADQAAQDRAGVRQHPQPGRGDLPAALGHQRRQPRDRAASRLARRGAAPQGRGGDGGRPAARGGLHLVARSRRRLGRRRSRHQCRRAEGRLAAACSASAAPTTAWTSRRAAC